MNNKINSFGRQPIAIITIDLPIDVNPFHSDEEIEDKLRGAISRLSFPEEARVQAFVGWLPDPTKEMHVVKVQDGFYKEFEPQPVVTEPQ